MFGSPSGTPPQSGTARSTRRTSGGRIRGLRGAGGVAGAGAGACARRPARRPPGPRGSRGPRPPVRELRGGTRDGRRVLRDVRVEGRLGPPAFWAGGGGGRRR